MKNNFYWTKTLLTVYKYLERVAGAVDKIILKNGLNSANITGQNYYYNNVYVVTEKLINLSQRKVTLINLKVLVEQTLCEVDEEDAILLIERFIESAKVKDIMQQHDLSLRSTFRKIERAIDNFGNCLRKKGYNDIYLAQMVKDEKWICNVHQRFLKQEDVSLPNTFLEKAIS